MQIQHFYKKLCIQIKKIATTKIYKLQMEKVDFFDVAKIINV